jgi:hypothetical protein
MRSRDFFRTCVMMIRKLSDSVILFRNKVEKKTKKVEIVSDFEILIGFIYSEKFGIWLPGNYTDITATLRRHYTRIMDIIR